MNVTVALFDNLTMVSPVVEELKPLLEYWKPERVVENYRVTYTRTKECLYDIKREDGHPDSLVTFPGFTARIVTALTELGHVVQFSDGRLPRPKLDMDRAMRGLFDTQKEVVKTMLASGGGVLSAATGFGKSVMSASIIAAHTPEAMRLYGAPLCVFACPERDINKKNWLELKKHLPDRDVGILQSGHKKIITDDVMVVTLDSLQNLDPSQIGLLICDEVHTGVSASRAAAIREMSLAIKYGVSATPGGRYDGRDIIIEALFGPVVCTKTYQDAVKDGRLVPIQVIWVETPVPSVGLAAYKGYATPEARIRNGIEKNLNLNAAVGELLEKLPDSRQALAIMPHIRQLNNVAKFAPSATVVHAETKKERLEQEGFLYTPAVSNKERASIYTRFNTGEIRKVISTYVYKQGVDFPGLSVVINAYGGGAEIAGKQIPGRASRVTSDKSMSFLVDFWPSWDVSSDLLGKKKKDGNLLRDAKKRKKFYADLGFEQTAVVPTVQDALKLIGEQKPPDSTATVES